MTDHITIRPTTGTWVVRAGGAVLGESAQALELIEGDRPPVIYFPRGDIAMTFLDRTDRTTVCPFKGTASYYAIASRSGTLDNAVWSYEDPHPEVSAIKGYLSFYTDRVAVEQV
ncbi:Uncharacterized conserved protein, DUF427 family [Loktanella fryxellensis]|uniref:Uncharacterized conserved protein, DUF427 family n=1 Tax=Loktanella fryxellensis TaxID=245187 RepID=A0A1H7Z6P3_9RHOB|nr:DUF427 domain-containing protein [Loktanella fryxellensis]SEM53159.1 Uncharacterized conserved protein, DUF427 family [Loktanella fryxellensis]